MNGATQHQNDLKKRSFFTSEIGKVIFLGIIFYLSFFGDVERIQLVRETLSDAFLSVSAFVAMTLFIFYGLEHLFRLDTAVFLKKSKRWHIPLAALMGALPGCGGAIMVITQYVGGHLGFASVVTALTTTMGDAAFLLLAREPKTALLVYGICIVAGVTTGYVVRFMHGKDFMRKKISVKKTYLKKLIYSNFLSAFHPVWLLFIIPGMVLAFGEAFQVDTNLWFGSTLAPYQPTVLIGFLGALLSCFLWVITKNSGMTMNNLSGEMSYFHNVRSLVQRTMIDTNFITVWVVIAFLLFELNAYYHGFNVNDFFNVITPLMPLIGVLVGFIPGCAPQIIVTTLYLQGVIPLSAQIGNAISNDGDALFPAIALTPKVAMLASLYTSVPALIIGYAWYFFVE